ncbi:uncharacterized protein LOC124125491 [Haliotis rufescens]|uniref:uncharacterized protein LOC124125491 n=1 Tax=Haliotis rufescens TaxID=6454 RepID=UPI00201E872D|nr:uncharacterized protein LOC124125491 [Haliotis rufescens]
MTWTGPRTGTWTRTWTCRGNVCLSNAHRTFYASNQKCDLVKVTLRNIDHLTQAIVELFLYRVNYWIGLKRNSVKKWNNGTDMLLTADDYFGVGAVLPTCLAVWKTYYNGVQFRWLECQRKSLSICEKVKVRTSTPPTRMSTHSTNTPTPPHIDPLSTSDVVHPSSTHRTTTKKSKLEGVADSEQHSNNGNVGIYVGSSTGAVVILVAVILILISYRKRLLCFKETPIIAASQDVNAIYDANPTTGGSLQENNVYETLSCASDRNSPCYSTIHVYNNTDPK